MKAHMDKARGQLGELASLADKTERAERRILEAAEARLDTVQQEIETVRGDAQRGDEKAEDRYLDLVRERGKLQTVIARARSNLA